MGFLFLNKKMPRNDESKNCRNSKDNLLYLQEMRIMNSGDQYKGCCPANQPTSCKGFEIISFT